MMMMIRSVIAALLLPSCASAVRDALAAADSNSSTTSVWVIEDTYQGKTFFECVRFLSTSLPRYHSHHITPAVLQHDELLFRHRPDTVSAIYLIDLRGDTSAKLLRVRQRSGKVKYVPISLLLYVG